MPRVVVFDEFGGPDVLRIVEEPVVEPAAGEVRVRIEAFAVNPLDEMMRSGASPVPVPLPHARLGVEGTGVIDALGAGVSGWRVGEPVMPAAIPDPAARGSYAEYITLAASQLVARPAGLDVSEAAAVWVGFSTAYGALVERAGMRPGDHVLITAASGAVGRAAIQIVRHLGAVPIAVTRSTAKRADLLAAGAAAVIATDHDDLAEAVRAHTGGAGADLVLDLVMGPGQQQLVDAARPGATLVVAGFLDTRPTPFPRSPSLRFFTYRSYDHTLDPVVVRRMAAFLNSAALRPAIDRVFTMDDVAEAHRYRSAGGKVVVTV